ncbi:MAG: hypothetical protein FWB74_10505 [Defluviitaleaceae bacterium]|nr:hypothetical protein [Defluviitaleaceae bacterium]
MVRFFQRECNAEYITVLSGEALTFDTHIAASGNDFSYNDDGSIDILSAGTYSVFWYVSNMTSQSTIGQSYELKREDLSSDEPSFVRVAGTSNHIKVSQTPGFAIVDVAQSDIDAQGRVRVALINTSDAATELTFFTPKAGILFFGLEPEAIEDRLTNIDNQITSIFEQLFDIEQFVHLSDVSEMWSVAPELLGLGAAVISSGYNYNFWGIGTLNHQQTFMAKSVYYLVTSDQFEPLTYYQGDSTIGTLWIVTPAPMSESFSMPIRFDETGIYFAPDEELTSLPVGTVFRFTQSLILVGGA